MEREQIKDLIIEKWQKEIASGELDISISATDLYYYVEELYGYCSLNSISYGDINDYLIEQHLDFYDIDLWVYNEWLRDNRYYDDIIYENTEDEINELYSDPYECLSDALNGDYDINSSYFKQTIHGLESLDDYTDEFEDEFKVYAVRNNITGDDDIQNILDNEDEIIEKYKEFASIDLNVPNTFYDCEVEDNVYVLLDKDFDGEITDVFMIDKKYDGQTIQNDISELCRTHDDYNNDMIADMLLEKYGADRKSFWALYY